MGLDAGFLAMLEASVLVERVSGKDTWGNESFLPPTTERAFIGQVESVFGQGTEGEQREKKAVRRVEVIMDAVGVSLGDRLTIGAAPWYVTQVETVKDEVGDDLYQNVTVEDQKKG